MEQHLRMAEAAQSMESTADSKAAQGNGKSKTRRTKENSKEIAV
jgi:hypothetical protein